jgi:pimeloyl-ACP methyl ester carboxylesterase
VSDDDGYEPPLRALGVIAAQEVTIAPGLDHLELYTMEGLLTVFWHGDHDAERVVLACGGAMGGLLGPAEGLYQDLGVALAEAGIGLMRVGWRRPNDLERCTLDLTAAADLASRRGARSFITMGHSFGGAIAVRTGLMLDRHCAGIIGLATQSAGCEMADALDPEVPLILFHGDRDEILPAMASEMVRMIAGHGELVVLPGTGHLMSESGPAIRERLLAWVPEQFEGHTDPVGR